MPTSSAASRARDHHDLGMHHINVLLAICVLLTGCGSLEPWEPERQPRHYSNCEEALNDNRDWGKLFDSEKEYQNGCVRRENEKYKASRRRLRSGLTCSLPIARANDSASSVESGA